MSYLDRLDDQIANISRLEDGWDSYGGKAPIASAIAWLRAVCEACAIGIIKHQLYFYPSADGGAHLEFDTGPYCVSATFDPITSLINFAATSVRPPHIIDLESTVSTVTELAALIRQACQNAAAAAVTIGARK